MDTDKLCFCIIDDEQEKGIGFTSATIPDLSNFFCALDKPKVTKNEDGTYEIGIIFCHAEKNEDEMTQYTYWYDIYLFNPADMSVLFQQHEIIDQRKDPLAD